MSLNIVKIGDLVKVKFLGRDGETLNIITGKKESVYQAIAESDRPELLDTVKNIVEMR